MENSEQHSATVIQDLIRLGEGLEREVSEKYLRARHVSPAQAVKEALKQISLATGEAQQVIERHANQTAPVTNAALAAAARVFTLCDTALNEVIQYIAVLRLSRE